MVWIRMKFNFSYVKVFFVFIKLVTALSSTERTAREYMVQIQEDWADVIKRESPRFGFKYIIKLVSNVYLFREELPASGKEQPDYDPDKSIQEFREFFKKQILHVERREYAKVKYYPLRNEEDTVSQARTEFGQWILQTTAFAQRGKCWPYYGMDVQEAWSLGYTGVGVRVAVVDTGIEADHPDLIRNVDNTLSHSFVNEDHNDIKPLRFPSYRRETDDITSHGTMAAGLIAGEFGNEICSAGIAFDATLVALKVFELKNDPIGWVRDGFQFDFEHVPKALVHERDKIDIYSCSFNSDNKFKAASIDLTTALKEGVEKGRGGKGSIFVFSAGNNKGVVYDCNMEALASSIYSITIASVGHNGTQPPYAIPCANTLASTYGEFKTLRGTRKLETTAHDEKCNNFTGTSASAALASGIFALTLQANPELTWRDLQHITVLSSSLERLQNPGQPQRNAIGLQYDPFFGFGLFNATAMVLLAKSWETVPEQTTRSTMDFEYKRLENVATLRLENCMTKEEKCVTFVEHVTINLQYRTKREQFTDIILCSPSKTCSNLLNRKVKYKKYRKRAEERNWNFTSVHFWGENPDGEWILFFNETTRNNSISKRKHLLDLKSAELTIYGTSMPSSTMNVYRQLPESSGTLSDLYDKIVSRILKKLPKPDPDDVLDFVEETTTNPTNYSVGIIMAVVVTLFIITAILSFRKNVYDWGRQLYRRIGVSDHQ